MLLDDDDDRLEDRCMADFMSGADECRTCKYRGFEKCKNQCEWVLTAAEWKKVWR